VPDDLCYVNTFAEPNRPIALLLPPGKAVDLRARMTRLVGEVAAALPASFESDEYQARLHALEEGFEKRSGRRLEAIRERARHRNVAMVQTPPSAWCSRRSEHDGADHPRPGRRDEGEGRR
jgi:hypothetical protein